MGEGPKRNDSRGMLAKGSGRVMVAMIYFGFWTRNTEGIGRSAMLSLFLGVAPRFICLVQMFLVDKPGRHGPSPPRRGAGVRRRRNMASLGLTWLQLKVLTYVQLMAANVSPFPVHIFTYNILRTNVCPPLAYTP